MKIKSLSIQILVNEYFLRKCVSEKMMSCIFKSLHLKRRVARLQESKYHYLEIVLVSNLIKYSCDNKTVFKIYKIIEGSLAHKRSNNAKLS